MRNYAQAAVRHFRDAELLAASQCLGGGGHLIGLAAECALKHAARKITSPPDAEIRSHLPGGLCGAIARLLRGRDATTNRLRQICKDGAFFADWDVANRYEDDTHVTHERFVRWKRSAARALSVADLARRMNDDAIGS